MFRFQDINYLNYLLFVPIFVVLYYIVSRFTGSLVKKYFNIEIFNYLTRTVSRKKIILKFFLEIVCLMLIVFSLARPQMGETKEQIKMEGIELVFAIDVSNSMLAEDLKPSRLTTAKSFIEKSLDRISGYKVGLIAFAGSAALVSPLTTDYSAIKMFLETINTDTISTQGTQFGTVIESATEAFQRGGNESDDLSKTSRVIVFLSDGEDHEEKALKQVKSLVDKGFRIFTVGVGTEQGAPIPLRDEYGQIKNYKKDENNQVVMSRVNTKFLSALAQVGGGAYYHASFSGDEIKQLEQDLNKLEKTEFDSDFLRKYDERYQLPLLLAFMLLLLEMCITDKKNEQEIKV